MSSLFPDLHRGEMVLGATVGLEGMSAAASAASSAGHRLVTKPDFDDPKNNQSSYSNFEKMIDAKMGQAGSAQDL